MKKSFTLIELIVSITILSLIILFISQSISNLNISHSVIKGTVEKEYLQNKIAKILYYDLLLSKNIEIKGGKKYSIIYLQTKNTLFDIDNPYVVWYVLKDSNTLCRLESPIKIVLPLYPENFGKVFVSKVVQNCEIFKIYRSNKKDKFLVYMKTKESTPLTFELYIPQK
ncbi:type II secretion system protein [Nitrosophilus labii]|uniref:type II secretion system protein n=1 Tax=Nitrosophilus labii TaxID=2706014 RepID=UPI0016570C4C|nr:type II secretion system protein [Nitrosophilus labii]